MTQINSDWIQLPSGLYVAKERTLLGKNFYEAQEELHAQNQRMLTQLEFAEFLKYTQQNNQEIYNNMTQIKPPWRAEWIDAEFKVKGDKLVMHYHVFDDQGKIIPKSEVLDEDTLRESRKISLESWLQNPTTQGLPRKDVKQGDLCKEGNLYYWYPRNTRFTRFIANPDAAVLDCYLAKSNCIPNLGVRAVAYCEQ